MLLLLSSQCQLDHISSLLRAILVRTGTMPGRQNTEWAPPGGWYLWTGAACVPAALYLFRRRPVAAPATDFDSFLRAPVPAAAAQTQATSFDAFLKTQPVASSTASTDFASFLRQLPNGTPAQAGPVLPPAAAVPGVDVPLPNSAPVLVMYGTEYGFSQEIAEKLCQKLKETARFWPTTVNMADVPAGYDFSSQQAVLMCCSTQGDGVPPTEARDFCDWLTAGSAGDLSHLRYSVLALGDTSYTHFCRCGKSLDAALAAAQAQQLTGRRDVDKEDWGVINEWMEAVVVALTAAPLKTLEQLGGTPPDTQQASSLSAPATKRYSKSRPYYATVTALEGLCVVTSRADKDTIRVALDLGDSGLVYAPGDALGIYPVNNLQTVEELLQAAGCTGAERVAAPSWHYAADAEAAPTAAPAADGTLALRDALAYCYDLRSPKAEPLLQLLQAAVGASKVATAAAAAANGVRTSIEVVANATAVAGNGALLPPLSPADTSPAADAAKQQQAQPPAKAAAAVAAAGGGKEGRGSARSLRQQLDQLSSSKEALAEYLAPRHVADVLREFGCTQLAPQQLLGCLRQLQPRLYSISSSPLEQPPGVQATVATVRYESLAAEREGVCSTFLADRIQVGQRMPVFISKNPDFRLPANPATPIIMVGPGTGLAPFRAFIQHRLLERQQQQQQGADGAVEPVGQMVLYFGCRRSDQDYLYGQQLEAWAQQGAITLHTAFSREGKDKVYVQHRLAQTGQQVWELLQQGGHFYVCGDAGSMAGAVEEALLDIIQQHQPCSSRQEAREYLDQLAAAGRYERDVWFS